MKEKPSVNPEWQAVLKSRASGINTVRNDIFTLNKLQLAVNVILGAIAGGGIIASAFVKGTAGTVITIVGVVFAIIFVVYMFALKTVAPTSILQYTCVEKGKTHVFQVLSKKRSLYFDGATCIETERGDAKHIAAPYFAQCGYDFFARMTATSRTVENGLDTFCGTLEHGGKTFKCKIAFDGDVPAFGTVGGARIKYFNVNSVKNKFIVPSELKQAAANAKIPFPKLPGLLVRDDISNFDR